jgi:excisionase family DNA binding protein
MDRGHDDYRHDGYRPEDSRHEDRILNIPETAKYMGIGQRHLYEITKSGALPRIKMGRSVRYSLADIKRYLEDRKSDGGR